LVGDPQRDARGDVFNLAQHFDRTLNFGQVRKALRRLIAIAPAYPAFKSARHGEEKAKLQAQGWEARRRLRRDSPAWRYPAEARCPPTSVLAVAADADAVGESPYGSAWFAHRANDGRLTGIEMRGPHHLTLHRRGGRWLRVIKR
jgi:hypothetical protein